MNSDLITVEEFRDQVKIKGIYWLPLRRCGFCKSPIGFILSLDQNQVFWDGDCECVNLRYSVEPRSWDHIVDLINSQETPELQLRVYKTLLGETEPI